MIQTAALTLALAAATPVPAEPLPLNPAVSQETIGQTICRTGWTRAIRPPHDRMRRVKRRRLAEIGAPASHGHRYQLDHLIPLTLGGAPSDPRNLALQPLAEARHKDAIESCLASAVCQGHTTLADAQRAIWTNWRAAGVFCTRPATENGR
jgi:hypothetical protein